MRCVYRKISTIGHTIFTWFWWPEKVMWLFYKIHYWKKSSPENTTLNDEWRRMYIGHTELCVSGATRCIGRSGGVWGAGVHGTAPAAITTIHCAAAIQYSLPHWNGRNIKQHISSDLHCSQSARQCSLSQLQGSNL